MSEPWTWIKAQRERYGTFSFEGQKWHYDQMGPPGEIVYRQYYDDGSAEPRGWGTQTHIDCLLYYGVGGRLVGILNHYPHGAWDKETGKQIERPGNVNLTLPEGDPHGARPKLLAEGKRRWNRGETPWEPHAALDGGHRLGGVDG